MFWLFDLFELRGSRWIGRNPYRGEPDQWGERDRHPRGIRIGIAKEFWHTHWPYIAAFRELDLPYQLIDLAASEWFETVRLADIDVLVVAPSVQYGPWKRMYDDRLRVISRHTDVPLFPSLEGLWFMESKYRMHYWLYANGFPHPKTHIFYSRSQAFDFARVAPLPLVYKMDAGSGAAGVRILKNRSTVRRVIAKSFSGVRNHRQRKNDMEHGAVLFQEFVPSMREWRIVQIGSSFFGFEKLQLGNFHSGSKRFSYGKPPSEALNLMRCIARTGGFSAMSIDVFETKGGEYLVNEIQPQFGHHASRELCVVDGRPGRIRYHESTRDWAFEEGNFCRNYLANLKLTELLATLPRRSGSSTEGQVIG